MHSTDKKVSVIIPVYNGEKFIDNAIKSVLNQTYHNFEIIVVDDGSIDSSVSILKKYEKNSKVKVQYKKKNEGQAAAINFALSKIQGSYIAYLDCDDQMRLNRL